MPNAIYPPHWHTIPPPEHPHLDAWVVAFLDVLLLLVALMLLGVA